MDTILDSLNPEQKAAVLFGDGPLLVLAGAGTGQTGVITHRIAHLIRRADPPCAIPPVPDLLGGDGEKLRQMLAVDFEALLVFLLKVLQDKDEVRARLRARFRHVLVDEFQDTYETQYRIARSPAGPGGSLCATG